MTDLQERLNTHTLPFLARILNKTKAEAAKTKVTWQVFPESPEAKVNPPLPPTIYYKSLEEIGSLLDEANTAGCGVFLTINHSGSANRKEVDIKQIRAVWVDLDQKDAKSSEPPTIEALRRELLPGPQMIVRSGHGLHGYWTLPDPIAVTQESKGLAKSVMLGLAEYLNDYGADRKVCEIARVMRVPGFFNMKSSPVLAELVFVDDFDSEGTSEEILAELQEAYPYHGPVYSDSEPKGISYQTDIPVAVRINMASTWLAQKDEAIQGDNGSAACMSAAWVGPRFALPKRVALELMMEGYNPRCVPEWTIGELAHKLKSAYESANREGLIGCGLPDFQEQVIQAGQAKFPVEEVQDEDEYCAEDPSETEDLTDEDKLAWKCLEHGSSDLGFAHRLKLRHGHVLQYWLGDWYYFNGRFWERRDDAPLKLLERTIKKILNTEVRLIDGREEKEVFVRWVRSLSNAPRLMAAQQLAKSLLSRNKPFEIPSTSLVNFRNGTVDLTTGELRTHDPSDCFLYCLPFEFKPLAPCPVWDRYLSTVFMGNDELIEFVQSLVGCTLLSATDDEFAVWLSGDGSNGKTTFTETIAYALGDLAQQVPNDLFLTKKYGQSHPTEIARLHQVKFATCSDISLNAKLDEGTFKRLVTTGEATGRYMHKDYFDFTITHKFWISVNNLPAVYDESYGLWRRMIVLPFDKKFTPEERDERIKGNLKVEAEGIWAWMVRGAIKFHQQGMPRRPGVVVDAGERWRSNEDWWENFLLERCTTGAKHQISLADLHEEYQSWAKRTNRDAISLRSFSNKIKQLGFETFKSSNIHVRGIRLKLDYDDEPSEPQDCL